jgi:hypothetical protein
MGHCALVHHGAVKHKFHWLSQVKEACGDILPPFLTGTTRVHTARRDAPSDRLAANACTTPALFAYLWDTTILVLRRRTSRASIWPDVCSWCGAGCEFAAGVALASPQVQAAEIQNNCPPTPVRQTQNVCTMD